ncbi:hypothetical protein JKF63_07534 [Porcisia hertigi]|uniref:Uncharacterized protein n=1 Tax=Porcisia hertigi TaxID=2761500 RepID=A0A836IHY6_9TRYP|nr:hypothetical protein JKF63_07534 [Porcisia hertigi]
MSSPEKHAGEDDSSRRTPNTCTPERQAYHDDDDDDDVIRRRDHDDAGTAVSHSSDVSSSSLSSLVVTSLSSRSSSSTLVAASSSGTPQSFQGHHHRCNHLSALRGDDHRVTPCDVNNRVSTTASRRVQISEHTRFTSVLAAGGRCVDTAGPTSPPFCCHRDGGTGCEPSRSQNFVWWRSSAKSTMGTAPTEACEMHPYCSSPHSPLSPPPSRHGAADVDVLSRDVAAAPPAAATKQRLSTSPLLTTASGVSLGSPTPLPPTHPRRSSSTQSAVAKSFSPHITGGGGAALSPQSRLASKGMCSASPLHQGEGEVCLQRNHSGRSVSLTTPTPHQTLRRSFSFTSGVWPSQAPDCEASPYRIHCPLSVTAGAHATPSAPRTFLAGERQHERTVSTCSSVHSVSSLARPSVPLPPSPIGTTSNMMAAVWVDLPLSQPASRCATPLKRNSDTYPPPRRRRTTPRRSSCSPSSVASTLAASIASSLEGCGHMLSTAGGVRINAHRLLVTASTQTDDDTLIKDGGGTPTPLPHCPHANSLSGCSYVTDGGCGDAAHFLSMGDPLRSEVSALATAASASVSSTSAEVSQRSLLMSIADICLDDSPGDVVLDGQLGRRGSGRVAADRVAATTTTDTPTPLSPEVASKVDNLRKGGRPSHVFAAPQGAVCVCHPASMDMLSLRGGAQTAAVIEGGVSKPNVAVAAPQEKALTSSSTPSLGALLAPKQADSLPAVRSPPLTMTGDAGAGQNLSLAPEDEERRDALEVTLSVSCSAASPSGATDETSAPPSQTHSLNEEVRQLRAELSTMRLHYAEVVQQLRQMQEKFAAAGVTPDLTNSSASVRAPGVVQQAKTEEVPSVTPPALPAASPASPLRSVSGQGYIAPLESLLESPSSASRNSNGSVADAVTTLDHVREALQRTRQRVAY